MGSNNKFKHCFFTYLILSIVFLSIVKADWDGNLSANKIRASARVKGPRFSYPESQIKDRLSANYNTCTDAWNDLLFWTVL